MKKLLLRLGAVFVFCAILFAGWLVGNLRGALRMPPEKAAIAVVRKYAIGVSGSNYSAREIGAKQERVWAWPRRVTYVVSLEGHACAQIRLKDIVGLGWQEESYEALKTEPNQAPEPTPGTVTPRADARVAPVPVVARL